LGFSRFQTNKWRNSLIFPGEMSIFAWTNTPTHRCIPWRRRAPLKRAGAMSWFWCGPRLLIAESQRAYVGTVMLHNTKTGMWLAVITKKGGGSQIRWSFDWSQPVAMTITDGEARSFGSMSEPGSGNLWLKFGDLMTWSTLESINQLACWLLIRET
jgi:hypothetical protein